MFDPKPSEEKKPGPPTEVILSIRMSLINGTCDVHGPLAEKGLCYQMLELARDVVQSYVKPAPRIIPAAVMPTAPRNGHA